VAMDLFAMGNLPNSNRTTFGDKMIWFYISKFLANNTRIGLINYFYISPNELFNYIERKFGNDFCNCPE
jgi:hypothetical protein